MASAADIAAYTSYLVQFKTVPQIQVLADSAAAEVASGDKVTSVNFEGGGANSQLFFTAAERLQCCINAIAQLGGVGGVTPPISTRIVFPNFHHSFLQT